jgi:hypothetical protein
VHGLNAWGDDWEVVDVDELDEFDEFDGESCTVPGCDCHDEETYRPMITIAVRDGLL